ncbi:MAG: adenylate/guanylate cyclase domain-containing protein [Saprospiraceae bacterium]|nr:adenylate/guanylate cyclase domain-containing protein [Saprospiraceae bacterium]
MIAPGTKRNIQRLIPFGLIWILSCWIFLIVDFAASDNLKELPDSAIRMDFQIFIFASIAMLTVGLLMGFIELHYLDHLFKNKNFTIRVVYKFLIYCILLFLVILVSFPLAASMELNTSIFDSRVWSKYVDYFFSLTHLSTNVQLATTLILSLFYAEISEFIGQDVLLNFFTGKYHTPREEERIFMFVDMKSSTTIAEQLGHLEYFKLLRAYYDCFTDAIIENEGEIYQYVGDEIIVSWKFQQEKKDNRCINCFFAMKQSLEQKGEWFNAKFGVMPSFKAGIHLGKVTTGEIGNIKKDILFTGDVLNATARIQGLCNEYGVALIVSDDLVEQSLDVKDYSLGFLGEVELKGKVEKMKLYGVE